VNLFFFLWKYGIKTDETLKPLWDTNPFLLFKEEKNQSLSICRPAKIIRIGKGPSLVKNIRWLTACSVLRKGYPVPTPNFIANFDLNV